MNLNIIKKNQKQIILFLIGVAVGYYLIPKLQTFVVGGQEGGDKCREMEEELAVILEERPNNWVVDGMELARKIRTCENDAASASPPPPPPPQETIQQAKEFYNNYHNTIREDAENWTPGQRALNDECRHTSDSAMKKYTPGKRVICRALHEAHTSYIDQSDIRNVDLSLSAAEAANNCKEKLETLLGITIDKDISDSRCPGDEKINMCQWTQNNHTTNRCPSLNATVAQGD